MRDNVLHNLRKTLREVQIQPMSMKNLNKKQSKLIAKYFESDLAPLLAPQIIDVHHPFPFLINKELYIFFSIIENGKTRYGIVPIPSYLPRIIYLNEEKPNSCSLKMSSSPFSKRCFLNPGFPSRRSFA
ncbi:hypothetical protein KWG61_10715 [Allobaculum sp. Allo2]|nr:hypothetical protein KWG61_10715 [Allobaculum sp. Allo2]